MRRLQNHLLLLVLLTTARVTLAEMLNDSSVRWGAVTNGLQMGICPVRTESDPEFEVAFRNSGERDVFVNLGITLANGRRHSPDAISLMLLDSQGHSRELHCGRIVAVFGRMDDYAVGLEVGSVHVLRLKLSEFIDPDTHVYPKLSKGHYKITARFHGHGAVHKNTGMDWTAWNFWEGALESGSVAFDVREPK